MGYTGVIISGHFLEDDRCLNRILAVLGTIPQRCSFPSRIRFFHSDRITYHHGSPSPRNITASVP